MSFMVDLPAWQRQGDAQAVVWCSMDAEASYLRVHAEVSRGGVPLPGNLTQEEVRAIWIRATNKGKLAPSFLAFAINVSSRDCRKITA